MSIYDCDQCGKQFEADELPRRGSVCFKCHVQGIRLGFTYGKDDWHGDTIKQRQELQVAQAKSAGIDAQPVGSRWV